MCTWCARLAPAPAVLGLVVLAATHGTEDWRPLAVVFLGCWVGLFLALVGLFGLIALRKRHADEHLPWTCTTAWLGLAGIVASMLVGGLSVILLSDIPG